MRSSLLSIILPAIILSGCASQVDVGAEEEVSLKYDSVPCPALIAQRDALRRQYPVLPPETGERMAMGSLVGVRDLMESGEHDARVARGKIRAMNDSLLRRHCITPQQAEGMPATPG